MPALLTLTTADGNSHTFHSDQTYVHEESLEGLPQWALLDCNQCPHCPLSPYESNYCPAAIKVVELVQRFPALVSYDNVQYTYYLSTEEKVMNLTAQSALSNLLMERLINSGCPILNHAETFLQELKSRFQHPALPLSRENLSSFTSEVKNRLLGNPYQRLELYQQKESLDHLKKRLDLADELEEDAIKNALVILHSMMAMVHELMLHSDRNAAQSRPNTAEFA